jgi:hypothetical protein
MLNMGGSAKIMGISKTININNLSIPKIWL